MLLAVRYLSGRVAGALPAPTGWLLAALLAAMALVRAVTTFVPHLGHRLELLGSMGLVAFALALGLHGRLRLLAVIPVALAAVVSLAHLSWYGHLLTHGHNLVPLIFLWDWARERRHRLAFVGANLIWLIGIPTAILLGLTDPLLNGEPPTLVTQVVDPDALVATAAPPGTDAVLALRLLAAFSFLQLMHYLLWMVFFQVWGRTQVQRSPLPTGWRFWTLAGAVSALVWAAYALSYFDGRAAYSVLGAFNAYLEQPVAVWLLLTALPAGATSALVSRLRE
ncbi:MAG: hypothetical protein KIT69_14590 [Propionibacteriaceae bacterium]|nr:hypothetical protein [Propionibacteriaceae bacterium]